MTEVYRHLLAKSDPQPDAPHGAARLQGHTAAVLAAAEAILEHRCDDTLLAMGLAESLASQLRRMVLLAAFAHDLGKCSEDFQQMVRGTAKQQQLVRHEALSLLLCWPGQPLGDWLQPASGLDPGAYRLAIVAAAGHHRKFRNRAFAPDADFRETVLLMAHPDFAHTLALARNYFEAPVPPSLQDVRYGARDMARNLRLHQLDVDDALGHGDPQSLRLLAATKALLVASDVAGSALVRPRDATKGSGREPIRIRQWIGAQLARRADATQFRDLVDRARGPHALRAFQAELGATSAPVTFVRAGCGSGKTLGAYHWAASHHAGRQLWVTYPTTGTATEGFRDYVFEGPVAGQLMHGRAHVDIEMFDLHNEEDDEQRAHQRVAALEAWGYPAIVCTVDSLLGIMQNQRRGLYSFPGIARSAAVFDEIHSYDDRLFDALLHFLRHMPGVPALLMTASLPDHRLRALRQLVQKVHGQPMHELEGPADLENVERYVLQPCVQDIAEAEAQADAAVRVALEAGKKVLWVSNTVGRCMAVAGRFEGALVYHSRFRYRDRVARHGDVIAAFQADGPAVATTTQVAEMSLDLSADLLVTDLASIPALIQRLGRLNRKLDPRKPPTPCPAFVLPFDGRPYEPGPLQEASRWLDALGTEPIGQRSLIDAWTQQVGPSTAPPSTSSTWIHGGYDTQPDTLREHGVTVSLLLKRDAPLVGSGRMHAMEAALPMLPAGTYADAWRTWPQVAGLPVAPNDAIHYDEMRGAQWK